LMQTSVRTRTGRIDLVSVMQKEPLTMSKLSRELIYHEIHDKSI
jgi:hypothetical protein